MDDYGYDLDRLRRAFGGHAEWQPTLPSTNDRARQLAAELPPGTAALVLADEQTAGRGRGSNRWWTAAGSIALSYLTPAATAADAPGPILSLASGVAVIDALAPWVAGRQLGLHWPNDVFLDARKLAGILVEALPDGRRVVGIGINANNSLADAPWEVARRATSLRDVLGATVDRTALVIELTEQLAACMPLVGQHPEQVARLADQACLQRGLTLTVALGSRHLTGRCAGIAPDGALLLDTPEGRQPIYSGVLVHE